MEKSDAQKRTSAVQEFIQRLRNQNPHMSYDEAWMQAKKSPELKSVFEAMTPKPQNHRSPPSSPAAASRRAREQSDFKTLQEKSLKLDEARDSIGNDPIYRG